MTEEKAEKKDAAEVDAPSVENPPSESSKSSESSESTEKSAGAVKKKKAVEAPAVALPGFYGIKAGMTRVFDDSGNHVPVTVIKLIPNFVTQVKTPQKDGYGAYQIAYGEKRAKLVTKPVRGILAKAKVENNLTRFAEWKTDEAQEAHLGGRVSLDLFPVSTVVDVTGMSKGKGFQGVVRRWNFAQGPLSHGSKFHRTGGSVGNRATPGKIWKNKKMPGHMGAVKRTVQNLLVVGINLEKGYMLIQGGIPGAKNSFVRVCRAIKHGGTSGGTQ